MNTLFYISSLPCQRPSFLWLFLKASFAETKLQGIKISLSWAWAKYTVCWFRTFANSRTVSHNLTNCSILTFVTSAGCSGGCWWRSPSSQVSSQVTMLWRHHRTLPQKYIRPDNKPQCGHIKHQRHLEKPCTSVWQWDVFKRAEGKSTAGRYINQLWKDQWSWHGILVIFVHNVIDFSLAFKKILAIIGLQIVENVHQCWPMHTASYVTLAASTSCKSRAINHIYHLIK